jgi:predicted ATPase
VACAANVHERLHRQHWIDRDVTNSSLLPRLLQMSSEIAAMSMARLWRDQDKVQQARELLAPVYGCFTEGFDTRDLKDAKGLLDQLSA